MIFLHVIQAFRASITSGLSGSIVTVYFQREICKYISFNVIGCKLNSKFLQNFKAKINIFDGLNQSIQSPIGGTLLQTNLGTVKN